MCTARATNCWLLVRMCRGPLAPNLHLFKTKTFHFSKPFSSLAWPLKYIHVFRSGIWKLYSSCELIALSKWGKFYRPPFNSIWHSTSFLACVVGVGRKGIFERLPRRPHLFRQKYVDTLLWFPWKLHPVLDHNDLYPFMYRPLYC